MLKSPCFEVYTQGKNHETFREGFTFFFVKLTMKNRMPTVPFSQVYFVNKI
jgi:hypothetical protein